MKRLNAIVLYSNVVLPSSLQSTGQLDTLNEMNVKLEEIQKSLDMYLETKRQIFPRFYFLSNDDLLEILGQSKNPEAVSFLRILFCYIFLCAWKVECRVISMHVPNKQWICVCFTRFNLILRSALTTSRR